MQAVKRPEEEQDDQSRPATMQAVKRPEEEQDDQSVSQGKTTCSSDEGNQVEPGYDPGRLGGWSPTFGNAGGAKSVTSMTSPSM
jgi:hypothetical protein